MATTPLLNEHITHVDEARKQFIETLTNHIHALREELSMNELILHSVVQSVSKKTKEMVDLDDHLKQIRKVQHNLLEELEKPPHERETQRQGKP